MKRLASLSLDLDNKWSYMKTHGDAGWELFPSYLDVVVPRALEFLRERDLKITFFIVGQDAALEKNHAALRSIADAGHEIGNHSFNHEPWLHLYSKQELVNEFSQAEDAISQATGRHPVGFRGPGYSLTPTVLEVLAERGYEYDCSTLPTYIGPLARAYYFLKSPKMTAEERAKRKQLFGRLSAGFQTLRPHVIDTAGNGLVEIPVTTFPGIKTPIHANYLLYLLRFSVAAAKAYWHAAVLACRISGLTPSLLLHPLDFLSGDEVNELRFFPGMDLTVERKIEFLGWALDTLAEGFEVVNIREHARATRITGRRTSNQLSPSEIGSDEPHNIAL